MASETSLKYVLPCSDRRKLAKSFPAFWQGLSADRPRAISGPVVGASTAESTGAPEGWRLLTIAATPGEPSDPSPAATPWVAGTALLYHFGWLAATAWRKSSPY